MSAVHLHIYIHIFKHSKGDSQLTGKKNNVKRMLRKYQHYFNYYLEKADNLFIGISVKIEIIL